MKVQIFFTVQTKLSVPLLVKQQLAYIKKYNIDINTKEIDFEYTRQIGIIISVNLQFAFTAWHKRYIEYIC